jgi:hypothetical protein
VAIGPGAFAQRATCAPIRDEDARGDECRHGGRASTTAVCRSPTALRTANPASTRGTMRVRAASSNCGSKRHDVKCIIL